MLSDKIFNVTIIDDDPIMFEMLSDYFGMHFPDSVVTCYSTGEEALAADLNGQQLILLDYYLSANNKDSMNGLQVLQQLYSRHKNIPVIVLSGQESPEVAANTVKHGAWDYIIKDSNTFNRLGIEVSILVDRTVMINEASVRSKMVRAVVLFAAALFIGLLAAKFV